MTRAEELLAIEQFEKEGKITKIDDPEVIRAHNDANNESVFAAQSARGRRAAMIRQRTTPGGRKRKTSAVDHMLSPY